MDENLNENAKAYATQHGLRLSTRLAFGMHGIIFTAEGNLDAAHPVAITVLKVHRAREPCEREKAVYERLKQAEISTILRFNVPALLGYDDAKLIIEMSIVTRPFVLDFAGAYLDFPPEFSDEI
jgi:hypothetical protein